MAVVSNSSPLIALARIQRLDLLQSIFNLVLVPPGVVREVAPSIPTLPHWIRAQALSATPTESLSRRRLGDGEREALALAVEVQAEWIILDDLPARQFASAVGLNVVGTLGVLLKVKQAGMIQQIRPELDHLRATSFFVGEELYEKLLRAAGEVV